MGSALWQRLRMCGRTIQRPRSRWSGRSSWCGGNSKNPDSHSSSFQAERSPSTKIPELGDDELRRFGLAGNPKYLPLKTPYLGWPLAFEETLFQLELRGFRVVLAHPERNGDVQASPELLAPLVERGLLVQLTAASLDGRLGEGPRKTCLRRLELGLATYLRATPTHRR